MDEQTLRYMLDVILPAMHQGFVISTSEGDISIDASNARIHHDIIDSVRDYIEVQALLYCIQQGHFDSAEWLKRRPVSEAA